MTYYIHKVLADPKDDLFDASLATMDRFEYVVYTNAFVDVQNPRTNAKLSSTKVYTTRAIFLNYRIGEERAALYYRAWRHSVIARDFRDTLARGFPRDLHEVDNPYPWERVTCTVTFIGDWYSLFLFLAQTYETPAAISQYGVDGYAFSKGGGVLAYLKWAYERTLRAIYDAIRLSPHLDDEERQRLINEIGDVLNNSTMSHWLEQLGQPGCVWSMGTGVVADAMNDLATKTYGLTITCDITPPQEPEFAPPKLVPTFMIGTAFHHQAIEAISRRANSVKRSFDEFYGTELKCGRHTWTGIPQSLADAITAAAYAYDFGTTFPIVDFSFLSGATDNLYLQLAAHIAGVGGYRSEELSEWIAKNRIPTINDVVDAWNHVQDLLNELHDLYSRLQDLKDRLTDLYSELATVYEDMRAALAQAAEGDQTAYAEYQRLKAKAEELKREIDSTKTAIQDTIEEINKVRTELATAKSRYEDLRDRFRLAKDKLRRGAEVIKAKFHAFLTAMYEVRRYIADHVRRTYRLLHDFASSWKLRTTRQSYYVLNAYLTTYTFMREHILAAEELVERSEALRDAYEPYVRQTREVKYYGQVFGTKRFREGNMQAFYRERFAPTLFKAALSVYFLKNEPDPNNFERWAFQLEAQRPVTYTRLDLSSWPSGHEDPRAFLHDALRILYGEIPYKASIIPDFIDAWKGTTPAALRHLATLYNEWATPLINTIKLLATRTTVAYTARPLTSLPTPKIAGSYIIQREA